ncbi:hypothetical protein [Arthrobacter sp. HY1533]|uniref:hypothetical protein n=1 Tax=Arthrobacter sp. HY1533 TaxID=2970919 RepID=UPI0022B9D748|nr:hypothetical protein [Arthrobacter sp. HY1533]
MNDRFQTFARLLPILCGLLMLFIGFVPMAVFYQFGRYDTSTPGLYAYKSATWGDAVLLPSLVAVLVYQIQRLPSPHQKSHRIWSLLIASIGSSAVVLGWLLDPEPGLNWTIPRPHVLNFAGSWHAAFLVVASTGIAMLWVEVIIRLRASTRDRNAIAKVRRLLASPAVAVSIAAGLAFSILAVYDSQPTNQTLSSTYSIISMVTCTLVMTGSIFWASGSEWTYTIRPIVVGVTMAVSAAIVIVCMEPDPVAGIFVFSAAAIGAALGLTASKRHEIRRSRASLLRKDLSLTGVWLEAMGTGALFIILPVAASNVTPSRGAHLAQLALLFILIFGLVLTLRVFLRGSAQIGNDYLWLVTSFVFLASTTGALAASESQELSGAVMSLLFGLLSAVLAGPGMRMAKSELATITEIEAQISSDANSELKDSKVIVITVNRVRLQLTLSFLAAFASILGLTILTLKSFNWTVKQEVLIPDISLIGCGLAIIVVVVVMLLLHSKMRTLISHSTNTAQLGVHRVLLVAMSVVSIVIFGRDTLLSGELSVLPIMQSALLGCFAFFCVINNGIRLHSNRVSPGWLGASSFMGVAVFVLVNWSLTVGVGGRESAVPFLNSLFVFLFAYGVVAALVMGNTVTAFRMGAVESGTYSDAQTNAAQDSLMILAQWLFLAWLPHSVVAHVPEQKYDFFRWILVSVVLIGFLTLYVTGLRWIIGVNNSHVGRQMAARNLNVPAYAGDDCSELDSVMSLPGRMKLYRGPDRLESEEEKQMRLLDSHIATQNLLAIALVVSSVLGFFLLFPTDVENRIPRFR